MKYTAKNSSDTKVVLTISLDETDLKPAKTRALKKMAPQVKIPGFRQGKVPANLIEKNLDPSTLANEVIEHAINGAINEVADKEDYRILDQPQIQITAVVPYTSLQFTAELELLPKITLGEYKKLKATRGSVKIEDSEIDDVMTRVRQQFADKKTVTRAAKIGDEVNLDFTGKQNGKAFEGGSSSGYSLTLGSETFIPGFEDAIVGHKTGETFDVPLTFPKTYQVEHLKGADVVFEVTINSISEVELPKVDDELAKKAGNFTTVHELEDDIRRELTTQKEAAIENTYKDDLVGELVSVSNVPVPDILVSDQIKSIERDALQNLMYQGMTADQYIAAQGYKDLDDWRDKEFKAAAERRVQAGLALAELSKAEKIQVEQDELNARHAALMEQYKNDAAATKQLDAPEARRDLANRVLTEKTVDRLIELNSH